MTKIKICGLKSEADIQLVNECKPDYCGFIIDFPKSHRSKTPDEVRKLVKNLDKEHVVPVGVFVNEALEVVASLVNDNTVSIAQLHGSEDENYINALRNLLKEEKKHSIIKAFQIKSNEDIKRAIDSSADMILLDKGQGEGEAFDWELLTESIERPWLLAGGLKDDNIEEAILRFHPTVVDLSSAVETDQKKDPQKVKRIIEIVREVK